MAEATEGRDVGKLLALGRAAIFAACLTFVLNFVLVPPAASQQADMQSLLNRIERMQRELSTLQGDFYRGGPPPSRPAGRSALAGNSANAAIVARMQVRFDEFETELRNFTGKIEEMNHNISQISANVKKLTSDLEFRLGALEKARQAPGAPPLNPPQLRSPQLGSPQLSSQHLGPPPVGVAAPAVTPVTKSAIGGGAEVHAGSAKPGVLGTLPANMAVAAPAAAKQGFGQAKAARPAAQTARALPSPLPPGTPEKQYKFAYSLLIQNDFVSAERSLRAFVAAHPKHTLAGNAKYWLGETYYVRNDFGNAARTFAEGYQTYPKNSKAPDNLLKLGMSLIHLGKKRDACVTLSRLAKEFPKASANILRRTKQERKRNGCRR